MTMFKDIRAALFDWDGTMVNSTDFVPDIHAQILIKIGIPLPVDIIRDTMGISQTSLIKMALEHNSHEVSASKIDEFIPAFVKLEDDILDGYYADGRITLKAGLVPLLGGLQQLRVPLAVVSNAYDEVTHKRLRDTGLMGVYFGENDVFGRTRAGTTKPNPRQITLACETIGCCPDEVIFFGDTMADRGACAAAGVRMIQIGGVQMTPAPFLKSADFQIFAAEIIKLKNAAGFTPPAP